MISDDGTVKLQSHVFFSQNADSAVNFDLSRRYSRKTLTQLSNSVWAVVIPAKR